MPIECRIRVRSAEAKWLFYIVYIITYNFGVAWIQRLYYNANYVNIAWGNFWCERWQQLFTFLSITDF